ncbi:MULTISPECIES: LysR family transcriptional regulator [unclassified Nocardioides]|uniref:LysR family transcriptional regulator n=1 Tax=unclassified Nocardioides TaxID=2615069 RepID=UPI000A8B143B|nr:MULTISPECIES: LysR family transcriptional regulator [unclassified Nocardioides]
MAHLRAFVAVADERSFTRAADACGVPQPVVSRRVAALEKHFAGALLRRTSREVELTPLGRRLLPHAADLIARADHLQDLARRHDTQVVVGLPRDADPRGLVTARRAGERAGVDVDFVELDPSERHAASRSGQVTVALTACPAGEGVMTAELGAATSGGAIRGRRVHLDQLRRQGPADRAPVLHLHAEDDVPWIRDRVVRAARASGLAPHQLRIGAGRTESVTAALDLGDVIVCTPGWAARHDLRWRSLGGLELVRSYAFTSQPDATLPAGIEVLEKPLADALGLT